MMMMMQVGSEANKLNIQKQRSPSALPTDLRRWLPIQHHRQRRGVLCHSPIYANYNLHNYRAKEGKSQKKDKEIK